MAFIVILILITVQLTCLGLLWISCFPGLLVDASWILIIVPYIFLTQYGYIPMVVTLVLLGWAIGSRKRQRNQSSHPLPKPTRRRSVKKWFFIMTGSVVVCTCVLLGLNLPQKIAFSLSRSAFEAFIADSAQVKQVCGQNVRQQFGLYRVEDCDRDPRGGIYFLTGWHGFMFTSAYGFVYQPNPEGSQRFGQDSYTYQVVIDQWYWFRASQDW